jgi:hypothetical protein
MSISTPYTAMQRIAAAKTLGVCADELHELDFLFLAVV